MELIKKYNYEDPLHMKGDPFGAADAKVAHVNQLITEVNSQTTSVDSLTSRVETLENAPAPTSEYYINGRIVSVAGQQQDASFYVYVENHNTPIVNNDGFFQAVLNFQSAGNSYLLTYSQLQFDADLGNGPVLSTLDGFKLKSCIINYENQLVNEFNTINRAFIGLGINPYFTDNYNMFIVDVRTNTYNVGLGQTIFSNIPPTQSGVDVNIMNFQLTFSEFNVSPV